MAGELISARAPYCQAPACIPEKRTAADQGSRAVAMERITEPGYASHLIRVRAPQVTATMRCRGGELSRLETKTAKGESFNILYEGNEKNQKITQIPRSGDEVAQIKSLYAWGDANSMPGSTVWIYPQEGWKGGSDPIPPLALNNGDYGSTMMKENHRVTLTSPHCRETDMQASREFDFSAISDGTVRIKHRLANRGNLSAEWGPWTLDRVKPGGVILVNGTRDQLKKQKGDALPEQNITPLQGGWLEISSKNAPFCKYGVTPNGREPSMVYIMPIKEGKEGYAVFSKKSLQGTANFPADHDSNCPAELCFNPYDNLIELELKGPLTKIPAGGSTREFAETRQIAYAETRQELEALIRKQTGIPYRYTGQ